MNEKKRKKQVTLKKIVLKTSHQLNYLVFVFLFKRKKKKVYEL